MKGKQLKNHLTNIGQTLSENQLKLILDWQDINPRTSGLSILPISLK